jgi:uncharacterized protein
MPKNESPPDDAAVLAETRAWVDRAVIGLNLCPFARAVQVKNRVRYVVSHATVAQGLLLDLCDELQRLAAADAELVDTTVLVHPQVLADFDDYNDFLGVAEAAVTELGLDGELQIASFHPDYRFEGTDVDDIGNATNRSPWPTLQLLREDSIDKAVAAFPDPEAIYENNIRTLESLGSERWAELMAACRRDAGRQET